ncbi:MAG TPA: DNA recombination protein RmuC [Gaiellaceae bacterium]|nr:DNA recombination protein RmuC [Gaiellaceae bacterium]
MISILALLIGLALGGLVATLLARARADASLTRLQVELRHERARFDEKVALLERAEAGFAESFKALSSEALRSNNTAFLELARTQLERFQATAQGDLEQRQKAVEAIISPIRESLEKVDGQIRGLEQARTHAYSTLSEQVRSLAEGQQALRLETGNLVTALRSPSVRGRWGEMQLRRVVEMAGMLAHCDFVEQTTTVSDDGRLRPDMIVKLPGGRTVVVDVKAPLSAYLESLEAKDDLTRQARLADHARQVREHVRKLSAKSYWSQFDDAPDFVVLFLPGEPFFSAALEQDPSLIEQGVEQQVILATPTTLIALLRAVAYGWRQEQVAESARHISELGRELHTRLSTMSDHFAKLGRSLDGAVRSYNETMGSLERRVLVTARRFKEHGAVASDDLAELAPIDRTTQLAQAPELRAADEHGAEAA